MLTIVQDNVHSREISLHDLNILHDGSDFVGPLRLLLRAIVPRFIIRYYALQEQVQRLHLTAETGEGEHDEGLSRLSFSLPDNLRLVTEHYDTVEEQSLPQQEEAANHPPTHAATVSEVLEVPPATHAEESIKESILPPEPTEETPQENYEPEDTSLAQETSAEYHEIAGEVTHALEDENDYEGTNIGDEDESAKSDSLDADQVHDTGAEDTDAPATVTGQESEFGGEQTEYLDYVQPEEYDERYGEDIPERAGGASPVQYGEPQHYEEEGEEDTSTTVDETQAVLPGSGEDEEDESAATPVPAHAVLEPKSSEPADVNTTDETVLCMSIHCIISLTLLMDPQLNTRIQPRAVKNSRQASPRMKLTMVSMLLQQFSMLI